jgi:hypothetical protein
MKLSLSLLCFGLLFLCGCADFSPAVSKTDMGNLELNVVAPEGLNACAARIYVDNLFIGNISSRMPVLQLKRGKRVIRVELESAETCTETITILGEPNHQILNLLLKKKT